MGNKEPFWRKEAQSEMEPKDVSKAKVITSLLKDYTGHILKEGQNLGNHVLEKTWYTHDASLFFLESILVKSLSTLRPELARETKSLGVGLWAAGIGTAVEEVIRTTKAKRIPVGEYMDIYVSHYRSVTNKKLADNTVIQAGSKIGTIDFVRDLPSLQEQDDLISFTRQLFGSAELSLRELAHLCEINDPRLEGVNCFYGISHLAGPLARRLGFETYEITDPFRKFFVKSVGKELAAETGRNNLEWQKLQRNFKDPQEAFISRKKLIDLYGSNSIE